MSTQSAQRILSALPALFRADPLLGRFLRGFDDVLTGLETKIDKLSTLFDPLTTPEDFVPWLSSWVAFSVRADLEDGQKRKFLGRIVSLYLRRGTLPNLQELLGIFTVGVTTIDEDPNKPHYFRVTIRLPDGTSADRLRQSSIAHALIDLEKPAHTTYDLLLVFPSMQIGVTSHIAVDTLLGLGSGN